MKEAHGGRLVGHFGMNKTLAILKEHLYGPKMQGDVQGIISGCATCQKSKSSFHQGMYTLLRIPDYPWDDVAMDLLCGYLELKGARIL